LSNEASFLSDFPEFAQHVVTIQWRADQGREDRAVIMPQRSSLKTVCSLALVVLAKRLHG
jgi:hypothetical protein